MGFLDNIYKDAKGVVDPRNYIKAGSELIHHPLRFGKGVGMQYVHLAEHPIREFKDHPLNTLLELAPLGKLADVGALGGALGRGAVDAGEGTSARLALMKAATQSAREAPLHERLGTDFSLAKNDAVVTAKRAAEERAKNASSIRRGLDEHTQWGATAHDPAKRAQAASAMRRTLDEPTQFPPQVKAPQPESTYRPGLRPPAVRQPDMQEHMLGTPPPGVGSRDMYRIGTQAYLNGEKMPNSVAGHDRFVSNRAAEYYAKQPEYKAKPGVNEGAAARSDVVNKGRELFDFSQEGRAAGMAARNNHLPLEGQDVHTLMNLMEDAHAKGNVARGDEIANHIRAKFHFDPYQEDPPQFHRGHPSKPPKGAPSFMGPYSPPNQSNVDVMFGDQRPYGPGGNRSQLAKMLLQQQMQQRHFRPRHRPSSN